MRAIKKYGNRRLYDTVDSRYIKLEELAARIRQGIEVQVLDARTNQDLTQVTLAQIILESRGAAKLLPTQLLSQLVRMEDEDFAEFFGRFVGLALELYLQARQGARGMMSYNPFLSNPLSMLGRLFTPAAERAAGSPLEAPREEVAELRREIEQLRRSMRPGKPRRRRA